MKNTIIKLASASLFLGLTACQEKLDNDNSNSLGNLSAVYMNDNNVNVSFAKSTESGSTKFEIRMSNLRERNETITIAATDFFPEYNEKNTTNYKMLPVSEYELYEEGNTTNKSTNGSLNITLKAGQTAVQVGVKVRPLNDDTFPLGIKYAIPLRIVSASLPILSNKDVVISLSRPFKTSVAKIKQGYGLGVKVADNIQGNDEFTVQGMFLFEEFHSYNNTNVNMSLFQGEMLPYTRIDAGKIQVKNGGGDSPDDWAESKDIAVGKWVQITFTYKDSFLKLYINGKLIKTYQRPSLKVSPGMRINIENTQTSYSANRYFREFRLWNRVLTDAEIVDGLYLPVDPTSKGLVAYLPITKKDGFKDMSKYNNTTIYRKGTSSYNTGEQDGDSYVKDIDEATFTPTIEWKENVKFPSEILDTED
ncbi:DUF1735 and LamG domain-containing protein [Capnocytophaga ochracea]|uniref:DUF1735 and LamG domain-containing protein n=1 Tax=Capnocytophaga TaxID=1016 RepID=UPI0006AF7828|nr:MULTISPECIES: DUF1735 and LamG domain-containing protein [Capnocytophaga]ALC98049.1 hypothetical protein AM608_10595 [Capnocytophaga sp. oral taxon 323]MEB3016739.1 DUF1735 and LamG domain-containing protein [Capnocytophaga ochracea]MEB3036941.1 DUF1735 and LamG domain-containing protein [Capnocytophaga ochracea]